MARITYKTETTVILDGKAVGKIKELDGGYQYFPKGSKVGGEVFTHLRLCKDSLEEK